MPDGSADKISALSVADWGASLQALAEPIATSNTANALLFLMILSLL
jgi:hypothetical protein